DAERQRWLVMNRGDEDRSLGDQREPEGRRRVKRGEEDERVVAVPGLPQMREQGGNIGALLMKPVLLFEPGTTLAEPEPGEGVEPPHPPRRPHREAQTPQPGGELCRA